MAQTHEVTVSGGVLTKRYRSWSRGEHRREWSALKVLSAASADLVPRPVEADLDADPPFVRMTLLPGRPLDGTLSEPELAALETTLRELWSVPGDDLRPIAPSSAADIAAFRDLLAARRPPASGIVAEAHAAAVAWAYGRQIEQFAVPAARPVIAHGDPNLANYLWDGIRVRIVDLEDAGLGDLDLELAKLVEHLSSRDTEWDGLVERLLIDEHRYRAARALWASFWLTLLMPGGPSADRNPPGTVERQAARVLDLVR